MIDNKAHPFQPGVEVALVDRYQWGGGVSYRTAKVAKVHKTGNFTLDGDTRQQYRAHEWDSEWIATKTGGSGYERGPRIEMITDNLIAEARNSNRRAKFRNAVEHLSRLRDADVTDEQLAHVEILVAQLGKKKDRK